MDVYKPYKARMTVTTSSYCSNRLYYQLPYWLMTTGANLRRMLCQGNPTEQLVDFGKLTSRRLVKWTQLNVDYLKGVVKAARVGLASGIVKLALEVARFSLWAEGGSLRVEYTLSNDEVA